MPRSATRRSWTNPSTQMWSATPASCKQRSSPTHAEARSPERCALPRSLAFDRIQDLDVQYYTPSSRSALRGDKNIRLVANLSHFIDANFPKHFHPAAQPVFYPECLSENILNLL